MAAVGFVGGDGKGLVELWDAATGQLVRTYGGPTGHQGQVLSVAFTAKGDQIATGGADIREQVEQAVREYWVYITAKIAERRGGTGDDLVSLVVNTTDDEPLSEVDLVFETMLVLVGGDEPVRADLTVPDHPEHGVCVADVSREESHRAGPCRGRRP